MKFEWKAMFTAGLIAIPFNFNLIGKTLDYSIERQSQMKIIGTSTLRDWESNVEDVQGNARIVIEGGKWTSIESISVTVPTSGIKSGSGLMDSHTYKALKATDYPTITYQFESLTALSTDTFSTNGILTIGGKTLPISFPVTSLMKSDTQIQFSGSVPIKMTDYGLKPPTLMMGAIKTGDEVTIAFEITLKPKSNE
jgi:hypothetical protein